MSTTKVVNLTKEKCDVRCSRTKEGQIRDVPHESCLGNPFHIQTYGRDLCIALFKEYFYKRLESELDFKEYVKSLKGKTLGCFCKPSACHLDIVKEYLDSLELGTKE